MDKPVVLTGLRANNDLHIGNYFGAMLPIIDIANKQSSNYQVNMFIPDLHSFTTPIDHELLHQQIIHNALLYTAAGLAVENSNILLYRQSYVPAHCELAWILDCFTGMGEMERMTQFKDKSTRLSNERISVGLFNYPVLMAADVLLYDAKYVPVGDDQSQHLEFTRDIAERMNGKFGPLFTIPEPVEEQHKFFNKGQALRIKDLVDPSKKMSKSDDSAKGVIFLTDSPEVAANKIMSAATDDKASVSYNPVEQPGISNLLQILALLRGQPVDKVESEHRGQSSYGNFKKIVADEMKEFLSNFQNKLSAIDEELVLSSFNRSESRANEIANAKLRKVQTAIGLRARI